MSATIRIPREIFAKFVRAKQRLCNILTFYQRASEDSPLPVGVEMVQDEFFSECMIDTLAAIGEALPRGQIVEMRRAIWENRIQFLRAQQNRIDQRRADLSASASSTSPMMMKTVELSSSTSSNSCLEQLVTTAALSYLQSSSSSSSSSSASPVIRTLNTVELAVFKDRVEAAAPGSVVERLHAYSSTNSFVYRTPSFDESILVGVNRDKMTVTFVCKWCTTSDFMKLCTTS